LNKILRRGEQKGVASLCRTAIQLMANTFVGLGIDPLAVVRPPGSLVSRTLVGSWCGTRSEMLVRYTPHSLRGPSFGTRFSASRATSADNQPAIVGDLHQVAATTWVSCIAPMARCKRASPIDEIDTVAQNNRSYSGNFDFKVFDLGGNLLQEVKGTAAATRSR